MTEVHTAPAPRVLVVGSGWRFTSGISYYTCRLTNALAGVTPTNALLMRSLVPRALYPGRARVGRDVHDLSYAPGVRVFNGVDWWWGPSITKARRFIGESRPDVVVLQWWTGAVLHSYLRLAALARRQGASVVMEWHEVQDTGEARLPLVTRYTRAAVRRLLRLVDAHVVHSSYDLALLVDAYGLDPADVTCVPHGPYDHVLDRTAEQAAAQSISPESTPGPMNLLYFGVIRPYKGVEDLVRAFDRLPDGVRAGLRLTIAGETWEGWHEPLDLVRSSPNSSAITVVNRYVSDAEVRELFAAADAVVLPYRRSSSSGPLHIAMSAGLPVVVTSVGGLVEAARDYEGAVRVPPEDVPALAAALAAIPARRGQRYRDPHSWDSTVAAYREVVSRLGRAGWSGPDEGRGPITSAAPAPASGERSVVESAAI